MVRLSNRVVARLSNHDSLLSIPTNPETPLQNAKPGLSRLCHYLLPKYHLRDTVTPLFCHVASLNTEPDRSIPTLQGRLR